MVIAQLMTLSLVGYSFAVESGRLAVRQVGVGARWADGPSHSAVSTPRFEPTDHVSKKLVPLRELPHSRRNPWQAQAPGLTNFSGQSTAIWGINNLILSLS